MSASRAIARWRSIHKWSSLACTLFLLVTCLTGLPLVFRDELAGHAPAVTHRDAPGLSAGMSLDAIARAATTARETPVFLFWPEDQPDLIGVGLMKHPGDADEDPHRVVVDRHSGAVGDEHAGPGWVTWVFELHRNLMLGPVGDVVLGVAALAFVLALGSGLFLYRPFARRSDFGTVRRTTRRIAWLDLHNLIGAATIMWTGVVAITGFLNTLEAPLFAAWEADRMPALMAHTEAAPAGGTHMSIDAVVATALGAAGGATPTSVTVPGTRFATPRHYLVWVHGDSPVTSRTYTPILVDGVTGTLTSVELLPWYLRMVELSRPLHFGDYGGLPLKLLWAVLDVLAIALLVTGLYLWLPRNRAAVADAL